MSKRRVWQTVLGATASALLVGSPALAELEINNRLPCPNGACVPNRMTFGYYPTRWRKWPVTSAAATGPTAAARDAVQAPQTSEPPAVNEDEVRSPFERLPRAAAPSASGSGDDVEPMPGDGGLGRDPAGEGPDSQDSGNGGSRRGAGSDQNGGPGPRRPRSPDRIFQPPRGNPPPPARQLDGARIPRDTSEGAPLALERPATLIPPAARPVSYATEATTPVIKTTRSTAKSTSAKRGAPSDNPLRKAHATEAAVPAKAIMPAESADDEGPQIVPTAAWIEEVAAAPEPTVVKAQWRANPLRGR